MRSFALALVALSLVGCRDCSSGTAKKTPETAAAHRADAAAAAAPRDAAPSHPAAPPVPAIGKTDPEEAARIVRDYRGIRGLFDADPEDLDFAPSRAQHEALVAVAGSKENLKWVEETAREATWPEAAVQAWLLRMARDARRDVKSVVRMFISQCIGWGSDVPSDWVATGCFDAAATFIWPVGETALVDRCNACGKIGDYEKAHECIDARCNLVVEGTFTGATHQSEGQKQLGGGGPVAHVFHIQKARLGKYTDPSLRLPGGAGPADGPAITSGPRWGVMWASAFATQKDAPTVAEKLAARMRAAGFAGAEVLDSRRIPGLWCCSEAVLAGRFEGRDEARALASRLKTAGFKDIIVRRIY